MRLADGKNTEEHVQQELAVETELITLRKPGGPHRHRPASSLFQFLRLSASTNTKRKLLARGVDHRWALHSRVLQLLQITGLNSAVPLASAGEYRSK